MRSESQWTHALAGAGAGLVSSIVTCPLDVIKTRLQAQKTAKGRLGYLGAVGIVKQVLVKDGVRGLYRGLGPIILGYLPTWAIYFTLYDGIKSHFGDDQWAPEHVSQHPDQHSVQDTMRLHVGAAMVAGATGSIATNPLWVIKTRFMTQPSHEVRYRHTLDAFVTIYKREGISAFYRGLTPSLFGITHVAVQFPLYEELKFWFAEKQHTPVTDLHSGTILLCSSIAKMTASCVTYPHEVVRTRLQVVDPALGAHPLSLRAIGYTMRDIAAESGWRGFYRGLYINLLRTVPNSGVTLLTYELLMRQFVKRD